MTTIDRLIELLESAKKQFGGEYLVKTYNGAGDLIDPNSWEPMSMVRTNICGDKVIDQYDYLLLQE